MTTSSILDETIFVTGFARGGTSWLRDCIAFHPDVTSIPREQLVFRDYGSDVDAIADVIEEAVAPLPESPRYVNKAPANAPHIGDAVQALPNSRFVFIVRDPRDAFISHKRSTREWTDGRNSEVDGCLGKLEKYWNGRIAAGNAPNLLVITYEALHQDFEATMERVFRHCNLSSTPELIRACWENNNFWAAGSRNKENRGAAARKGVVGDWIEHLDPEEEEWIRESPYWSNMMDDLGYTWTPPTVESVLKAIASTSPNSLNAEAITHQRLDPNKLNVVCLRDLDVLNDARAEWIKTAAQTDASLGLNAIYNVLPLDDQRYAQWSPEQVAAFARDLATNHDEIEIGMHINPVEAFHSPDDPDLGNSEGDAMPCIIDALHAQIDAFSAHGLEPILGTAHGYGRRKMRPNNRDSPLIAQELQRRGITTWDSLVLPDIKATAPHVMYISDVGGAIGVYQTLNSAAIDDPALYQALPKGSLLVVLSHPGNYDPARRLQLGRRTRAQES